jgi:hypothetical protein
MKPSRRRQVFNFYGGRICVVCGEEAHVHHLDENNQNHTFSNLIPLCPTANTSLENNKSGIDWDATSQIIPQVVMATGTSHFLKGAFRHAYACNRLGAYIYESRYHDYYRSAEALAFCLSSLAPVGTPALIHGTVKHFQRLHYSHKLETFLVAEFLNQCALILYSSLNLKLACDFESAAALLWRQLRPSTEAHVLQLSRRAFVQGANVVRSGETRRLIGLAESAVSTARDLKRLDALGSALHVNGLMEFYSESFSKAEKLVDEAAAIRKKCDPGTQGEILTLRYLLRKRSSDVERLLELQNLVRLTPIPIRIGGELRTFNPPRDLLFGIRNHLPQITRILGEDTLRLFQALLKQVFTRV